MRSREIICVESLTANQTCGMSSPQRVKRTADADQKPSGNENSSSGTLRQLPSYAVNGSRTGSNSRGVAEQPLKDITKSTEKHLAPLLRDCHLTELDGQQHKPCRTDRHRRSQPDSASKRRLRKATLAVTATRELANVTAVHQCPPTECNSL